ncbi:hypothetical protein FAZ69_13675 [Trinickia terrae]|uniref:LysR substrate-binding domain-containing protein n=1 Tax=Trinickia terrae TaxID=2571161 RepID=A0A4V6WQA8_9BURK|nr:hypothetical protein [Trinickia terrae]TKC88790.1 hypothetical protein FAZ69_13675 [Trinickia terrae]
MQSRWQVMELASYHTMLACVAAGTCFALCPKPVLDLQCAPENVRAQEIAKADTCLVTRSAYSSGAYEALLRSVEIRVRAV